MSESSPPRANDWLLAHARNESSQFGEDGIIEQVLEVIGDADSWCVEFGAWDGKHLSNTRHLIQAKSYRAVLIEADAAKFQELRGNYADNERIIAMNRRVGFDPADGLDALLATTAIPRDFDLLSIDIDGNDYHIWESLASYRPKCVVIEFNPTIPDQVDYVQARDMSVTHGSSAAALRRLGKQKGYELVATTLCNCILIDGKYFDRFGIADNSLAQLRREHVEETFLFQGFDGTILLAGRRMLCWHGLPMHEEVFQVLPRQLRKYPDDYNDTQKQLFEQFRQAYLHLLRTQPELARTITISEK